MENSKNDLNAWFLDFKYASLVRSFFFFFLLSLMTTFRSSKTSNKRQRTARTESTYYEVFEKMKLVSNLTVAIIFVAALAKPLKEFEKTYRYYKITCSSSNKTCIKPFCYLKNSRNDSTFSVGCDKSLCKKMQDFAIYLILNLISIKPL